MKDKSYSGKDNSHYSEPSMYGKIVREQYNQRKDYCNPGKADGKMKGSHRNTQPGP